MRSSRPWRGAYLVDAPVLYGVIVFIELIAGAGPLGAFGMQPHPYWIPILTLAAAQGTVAGLFAVLMGVSIQLFGLTLAQGLDAAVGTLVSSPSSTLYFLGGAFVIGEIHDMHAARFRYLQALLSRESTKGAQLQYERDVLLTANSKLRQRIEEEPHQLAELFDSTARIQRSPNEEIYSVLTELVRSHCGATKVSVLQPTDDEGWTLRATVGWTDEERDERLEALERSSIVALAVRESRGVQAFEIGVKLKAFDPFYVVPLFRPDGSLRAVVSIDEMPAQEVSPGVAAVFFGIAEWADATLALAPASATTAPAPTSKATLATPEEFGERLRLEYHRVERYGGVLRVACLHVPEWRHNSPAARLELDRVVLAQLRDQLGSETLYRFGAPGCYVVVQHGVTVDTGPNPPEALVAAWEEACARVRPKLHVHWVPVDVATPDPHSLLRAMANHFQEQTGRADESVLEAVRMPVPGPVGDLDTLLRRVPLEAALASETGDACHVAVLRSDPDGLPFELGTVFHGASTLRPTDGVFLVSANVLVALMPNSARVDAEVATTRFLEALRELEGEQGAFGRSVDIEMMDIERLAAGPFTVLGIDGDAS